ncbi:MAG: hypothetical protein IIB78_00705 [Proteobacteria bacterium]|nr:hypothetical protein [Pseudomonadota bacterium]
MLNNTEFKSQSSSAVNVVEIEQPLAVIVEGSSAANEARNESAKAALRRLNRKLRFARSDAFRSSGWVARLW